MPAACTPRSAAMRCWRSLMSKGSRRGSPSSRAMTCSNSARSSATRPKPAPPLPPPRPRLRPTPTFSRAPPEAATAPAAPAPLMSANAYLGAWPIAEALRAGADIVITGRCVDSASLLGIAAYEFGWSFDEYDKLAQASLAGHLIECGAQATGGLFTDWETVPDWAGIGYPIVELRADGSFELSKPLHTGGCIHRATVAEQLLYEIGDPARYALPDVVCDFTQVRIENSGDDRVRVTGARGQAPSDVYKVTTTFQKGFQIAIMMAIRGQRAKAKAERTAQELL